MNSKQKAAVRSFFSRNLISALLLVIIAAGAFGTWWNGRNGDEEFRAKIVRKASLIAEGLDLTRVRLLSNSETYSNFSVYSQLKDELAAVQSIEPEFRRIYLLERRPDDKICFLVDSEPADSKECSPSGLIYREIRGELRRSFLTREPETTSPHADRRGKWISAAIPIVDPLSISETPPSPAQAEAMVHKAVAYYKKNGKDQLLKAINDPNGEFCEGSLYAFAFDRNMTSLAHPEDPELVGKNRINQMDWPGGKYFRKEIQQKAQTEGKGWIEYERLQPVTHQLGPKITYFEGIDDLILCSGASEEDGHVLAELCVDVDSRDWNRTLLRSMAPPALLAVTLLALVLGAWSLRDWRTRQEIKNRRKCRLECATVLVGGLLVASLAGWLAHDRELQNRAIAFNHLALDRSAFLAKIFHGGIGAGLNGLGHYFEKHGWAQPDTFSELCEFLPQDQGIQSWEWAEPVRLASQKNFESANTARNSKPFVIWQTDDQGRRIAASTRDVYYPVSQVAPVMHNTGILGYDLYADPLCRTALDSAAQSGLATAVGPVSLRLADGNRKVIVLCAPFFGTNAPPHASGFALATLRLDPLFQNATHDNSMSLELDWLRKNHSPEVLSRSTVETAASEPPPLTLTFPIFAFGSTFWATAVAGQEFLRGHPMRNCWLTAATGLLLTTLCCVVIDLLVQRRRELEEMVLERTQALIHEQEVLQALMDNVPDFIYFKDVNSRFTRINRALAVHLGLKSPEEAIGKRDLDFYSLGAGRQKLLDERRLLATGIPMLSYVEGSETAHEKKWVSSSKVPILDKLGKITGLVGISRDITELKLMEDVLRKFSQAIEQSPTCVVITDCTGKIEYVNPKLCQLTGYEASELIGKNPRILKSGHTQPHEYWGLWRAITAGNVWQGEFLNRKKNGEFFWESALISPIKNAGGRTTHYLGIKEDITERKQAEAEILKANRSLEEATARANEMAARANAANAAKSEFLANMSHEIRTPLNGVLGMLRLLGDTPLSEAQARYAQIAEKSGESLLQVINNILDFSKIEARKLSLETVNFNLHELLDNLIESMSSPAQEKGLEFGCVVSPAVPVHVQGDSGRVRQILTNLVGNAIKFTSQGSVVIRVAVVSESVSKINLHFTVRDTGIGIPADKIERLFAKFAQVDSSTTRLFGGTGLGLAISKELAEMMGGTVGVNSEPGKGSEFWFDVQLIRQPLNVDEVPSGRSDWSGLRVLVVDEQAVIREMFSVLLKSWKMRPTEAANGEAALAALGQASDEQDPFQIVILDSQLPERDGRPLAVSIKRDPRLKDTRLVMCVPFGQAPDSNQVKNCGFAGSIGKPVQRQRLKEMLSLVIIGVDPAGLKIRPPLSQPGKLGPTRGKVLVVEDNITNQQVTQAILEKLGLATDVVSNGLEAIKALETSDYGLVLMDAHMPEMDGWDATQIIRNPRSKVLNHAVPVVAMTACATDSDRDRCTQAGMNEFLSKPIDIKNLVSTLDKWLPQTGTRQSPPGKPELAKVPVFRRAALMERLMDDHDLAHQIIRSFLDSLPEQIQQLKHDIASGDLRMIQEQTHKLKGAAANLSGESLAALANSIEQAARQNDSGTVSRRAEVLEKEVEALVAALENELTALPARNLAALSFSTAARKE